MHDTDAFSTEINLAATLAALRGVKRLRLAYTPECERGRSFLETKWEAQTEDRRREWFIIIALAATIFAGMT